MTRKKSHLSRDPAFESFLGATVGEDGHGASVTVLSMLARLEVDPWVEAADLAALKGVPARKRLDDLLKRFKDVKVGAAERGSIVSDLLSKLPQSAEAVAALPGFPSATILIPNARKIMIWIIAIIAVLIWFVRLRSGS